MSSDHAAVLFPPLPYTYVPHYYMLMDILSPLVSVSVCVHPRAAIPALMARLDSTSLVFSSTSSPPPPNTPPSPPPNTPPSYSTSYYPLGALQLDLHSLAVDQLNFPSLSDPFLCTPSPSLPQGLGGIKSLQMKHTTTSKVWFAILEGFPPLLTHSLTHSHQSLPSLPPSLPPSLTHSPSTT